MSQAECGEGKARMDNDNQSADFSKLVGQIKPVKVTQESDAFFASKQKNLAKIAAAEDIDSVLPVHVVSESQFRYRAEDTLFFRQTAIADKVMKNLVTGQISPVESIDLHGMKLDEASVYLQQVLEQLQPVASEHRPLCLRVVHGKGYNRDTDHEALPRMKNFVANYLLQHPRVLAYASCPMRYGGTGAVYVLLKSKMP